VLPLPLADDPAPLMEHWLLASDPLPFSTIPGSNALPASFTRYSTLLALL
jgi:hypothetical protein